MRTGGWVSHAVAAAAVLASAVLIPAFCIPAVFAGASEVWFDEQGPSQWIYRATPDGTLLPRIGTGETCVNDLTVIGNEVWFSVDGSAKIGRLDFNGEGPVQGVSLIVPEPLTAVGLLLGCGMLARRWIRGFRNGR